MDPYRHRFTARSSNPVESNATEFPAVSGETLSAIGRCSQIVLIGKHGPDVAYREYTRRMEGRITDLEGLDVAYGRAAFVARRLRTGRRAGCRRQGRRKEGRACFARHRPAPRLSRTPDGSRAWRGVSVSRAESRQT